MAVTIAINCYYIKVYHCHFYFVISVVWASASILNIFRMMMFFLLPHCFLWKILGSEFWKILLVMILFNSITSGQRKIKLLHCSSLFWGIFRVKGRNIRDFPKSILKNLQSWKNILSKGGFKTATSSVRNQHYTSVPQKTRGNRKDL